MHIPAFTPGQRVEIHSLVSKPELNGLVGVTTSLTSSGRWGVSLNRGGAPIAVQPTNLRAVFQAGLMESHHVQLRAVQHLLENSGTAASSLGPVIWSFLRRPCELAVFQTLRLGVEIISLQASRKLYQLEDQLPKASESLYWHALTGAGFAHKCKYYDPYDRQRTVCWDTNNDKLVPRLASDAECESASSMEASPQKYSFPIFPQTTLSGRYGRRPQVLSVISTQDKWTARVSAYDGTCWFYGLDDGRRFAECKFDKHPTELYTAIPEALWIVAHGDVLLILSGEYIFAIRVCRKTDDSQDGDAKLMSRTHFNPKYARIPLALNKSFCALICDGGRHVQLHRVGIEGISKEPVHIFDAPVACSFSSVAIGVDTLILLVSEIFRSDGLFRHEILIYSLDPPCQILRSWEPPLDPKVLAAHISCRAGLLQTFKDLIDSIRNGNAWVSPARDDNASLPVIENVSFEGNDAGPAAISPTEASSISMEQWASWIAYRSQHSDSNMSEVLSISAVVLTFNRHPQCFDAAVCRSALGRRIAAEAEVQPSWASGAKILVPGLDEDSWRAAGTGISLSSYHVVVSPEDVAEVERILLDIPASRRPRPKPGVPSITLSSIDPVALFRDISNADVPSFGEGASQGVSSIGESSVASSMGSAGLDVEQAWLDAVHNAVTNAQLVHINARNTFLETPESVSMPSAPSRHTV